MKLTKPAIITIGTFDGVHIGHQKLLKHLIEVAKIENLEPTLLTFFPHPRMVLQKDCNLKLINTISEKRVLLEQLGVQHIVVKPFDKAFSRLTALEFVRGILVNELNTKHIIIGYDHRFGKNRSANIDDLKEFGSLFNFKVERITAQTINAITVSSTKIRKALANGNIEIANTYLGYNFTLTGQVVKGKALGRTLGFPTANIKIPEVYKLIPKQGAYIVSAEIENQTVFGMLNIGTNPTVNGEQQSIEVHFFNFNSNLYNQTISIHLLHRIRDEIKFKSVEALKTQLDHDKTFALRYITTHYE